jgi:hypothetical protein
MLFIVSGAFDRLAEVVRQRVRTSGIGFSLQEEREDAETEYLRLAQTRDFITYGFEPEFVGRLPIRVVCDALGPGDLEQIMRNAEGSVLGQYELDFEGYGIRMRMTPDAIRLVAQKAHGEKTGARGLMTVLERVFRDYKFDLPSTSVKSFEVTADIVREPGSALAEVLRMGERERRKALHDQVARFARVFQDRHGLKHVIEKDAAEIIVDRCLHDGLSVGDYCAEHYRDLEYGLKLIARNTGQSAFTLTRKLAENPSEELSRRVARSFQR